MKKAKKKNALKNKQIPQEETKASSHSKESSKENRREMKPSPVKPQDNSLVLDNSTFDHSLEGMEFMRNKEKKTKKIAEIQEEILEEKNERKFKEISEKSDKSEKKEGKLKEKNEGKNDENSNEKIMESVAFLYKKQLKIKERQKKMDAKIDKILAILKRKFGDDAEEEE